MKQLLLLLSILLSACSSMPTVLKNAPAMDVQLEQVLGAPDRFRGTPVRWGGSIIDVENEEDATEIHVLYYPLDSSGRPRIDKKTQGRFVVRSQSFLDPAIYEKDSKITVTGTIKGAVERAIGKKMLALPLVEIGNIYIWPEADYQDVYYYGPYMGYYPYYYYPYSRFGYYYYPWY